MFLKKVVKERRRSAPIRDKCDHSIEFAGEHRSDEIAAGFEMTVEGSPTKTRFHEHRLERNGTSTMTENPGRCGKEARSVFLGILTHSGLRAFLEF